VPASNYPTSPVRSQERKDEDVTFLELVVALHTECGAAGVAPTAVTGQTGENQRLVNWIIRADLKIQRKWINWKFLRAEFDTANETSAGVATLSAPADLKTWDLKTFKIQYPGETTFNPLPAVEYENVKGQIIDDNQGPPGRVIIMPDDTLLFEPVPNGVYTVEADYYQKPVALAANADESLIPEEYHESAILGRALMYYANFENAPEIKTQGKELYDEGIMEMENHQLPNQNYSRLRTGGGFEVIGGQFDTEDEYFAGGGY
jgi:hypothetical protein